MELDLPIGERIAIYRRRRGLSQVVLAGLVGRTEAWLSQIERGARPIDRLSVLTELARVLEVDLIDLVGHPYRIGKAGSVKESRHVVVPAIRDALMRGEPPPGAHDGLPSLRELRGELERVWHLWHASEYPLLVDALPRLLRGSRVAVAEMTGDERRVAAGVLAETCHAAAILLTTLGEVDLGWIAADRGVLAGEQAHDPVLLANSAYYLGHVFMRSGRCDKAEDVLLSAAGALEPQLGAAPSLHLAAYGGLLLTAAVCAARTGDRTRALQYLEESEAAANRVGEDPRNRSRTWFGPTNVALHAVAVAVELGDGDRAVKKSRGVDLLAIDSFQRRGRHFVDLARAYAQRGDDGAAVRTLLAAERLAPEEVRYQPFVWDMVRDFLRRERRGIKPELRGLAARLGVLS